MEITVWHRVLIIAAFVTIIFALLLCFAAGSDPALGMEAAGDRETPWPGAAVASEDGTLSGTVHPAHDRLLIEPVPAPHPDEFEPDNAKHQASRITVGDPQRHNFQQSDEDWVKFWAWANHRYTIRTSDLDNGCNTVLCIHDAGDTKGPCDDDGGEGLASRIDWTPDASGVYFVHVSPDDPRVSGNLWYTLAISEGVRCGDGFEPDDTPEDAKPVTDDPHTFHGPCGGDADWASFQAVGGEVYAVWTSDLRENNDTVLELYDAAHQKLAENDDCAENAPASRIVWQAPADGTYLVKVSPFEPTVGGCDLEYTLHVDTLAAMPTPTPTPEPPDYEPDAYEPDDLMHQANRIVVHSGVPQEHAFHSYDDQDWVKFWAWDGHAYTIETRVGPGTATTVKLYDLDGHELPVDRDETGDSAGSRINWTALENGSYFVRVAYPGVGSSGTRGLAAPDGLTYSLVISETIPCREEYEPDNTQQQAAPIEVDGDPQRRCFYVPCFDRYHSPDTADWVSFQAPTCGTYEIRTFDLTGINDTVLELHALDGPVLVDGDEVVSDDHAGDSLASRIVWKAPPDETGCVTKTYYVKVSPLDPRIGGCEACYSLEVNKVWSYLYLPLVLKPPACHDQHEPDNDRSQCMDWPPLEPDAPVSGYICQQHVHWENGDLVERDWYWFEIDKLRDIEVHLDVPGTVNYDLFLWVGRKEGSECVGHWEGSQDPAPGGDEHISWSAECIGEYRVVVKSLGDYDNHHPYTLRLTLK